MSRTLRVALTVTVDVTIPEGHPLTADWMNALVPYQINDFTDGRHPFSEELIHRGAVDAVKRLVEHALFDHYAAFPMFQGKESQHRLDARNAIIEQRANEAFVSLAYGEGPIKVVVTPCSPPERV